MKKKTKNKEPETLEGLFDSILDNAKINAAAGEEVGKYLMSIVGEIGLLTTALADEINQTLAALAWVAGQITNMVDRLKEGKNETIH